MLIATGITFSWVLIMIWWLSQEYLFTGTPSYTATHKLGTEHSSTGNDWDNSKFKWERREMEWNRCAVVRREERHAYGVSTHNRTPPPTKLYTRAQMALPLNHLGWRPIHLLLVDWDPITIPNRARREEWQTASSQLIVDWWDKSWGGSWAIPYQDEHPIKNLWCDTALENSPLTLLCVRGVSLLSKCVFCYEGIFAIQP